VGFIAAFMEGAPDVQLLAVESQEAAQIVQTVPTMQAATAAEGGAGLVESLSTLTRLSQMMAPLVERMTSVLEVAAEVGAE
jgi:predicted xylose isomerase-like sugar epimerase